MEALETFATLLLDYQPASYCIYFHKMTPAAFIINIKRMVDLRKWPFILNWDEKHAVRLDTFDTTCKISVIPWALAISSSPVKLSRVKGHFVAVFFSTFI